MVIEIDFIQSKHLTKFSLICSSKVMLKKEKSFMRNNKKDFEIFVDLRMRLCVCYVFECVRTCARVCTCKIERERGKERQKYFVKSYLHFSQKEVSKFYFK
jgi:hypothetical protein